MRKNFLISILIVLAAAMMLCTGCFAEDEFVPGTRTSSEYINESNGFRIELTDKYVMATDEEILQMMNLGADVMLDSEKKDWLMNTANITLLYEMMASNPNDGSSILVIAEKPMLSGITMEQYAEINASQVKSYFNPSSLEQGEIGLCGRDWNTVAYTMNVSGINVINYTAFTRVGDRFVSIGMSGLTEDVIDQLSAMIYCLDQD